MNEQKQTLEIRNRFLEHGKISLVIGDKCVVVVKSPRDGFVNMTLLMRQLLPGKPIPTQQLTRAVKTLAPFEELWYSERGPGNANYLMVHAPLAVDVLRFCIPGIRLDASQWAFRRAFTAPEDLWYMNPPRLVPTVTPNVSLLEQIHELRHNHAALIAFIEKLQFSLRTKSIQAPFQSRLIDSLETLFLEKVYVPWCQKSKPILPTPTVPAIVVEPPPRVSWKMPDDWRALFYPKLTEEEVHFLFLQVVKKNENVNDLSDQQLDDFCAKHDMDLEEAETHHQSWAKRSLSDRHACQISWLLQTMLNAFRDRFVFNHFEQFKSSVVDKNDPKKEKYWPSGRAGHVDPKCPFSMLWELFRRFYSDNQSLIDPDKLLAHDIQDDKKPAQVMRRFSWCELDGCAEVSCDTNVRQLQYPCQEIAVNGVIEFPRIFEGDALVLNLDIEAEFVPWELMHGRPLFNETWFRKNAGVPSSEQQRQVVVARSSSTSDTRLRNEVVQKYRDAALWQFKTVSVVSDKFISTVLFHLVSERLTHLESTVIRPTDTTDVSVYCPLYVFLQEMAGSFVELQIMFRFFTLDQWLIVVRALGLIPSKISTVQRVYPRLLPDAPYSLDIWLSGIDFFAP